MNITPEKFTALLMMLMIASFIVCMTYPWRSLPRWGRIAVALIAALFGLPPLIALWMTGVL